MSTLLIRLAAPLQAWGTDSKFEEKRRTQREPSKSGVIGLLAAAIGLRRDASLDELTSLGFGARIDQPGQLLRDYHTARPEGKNSRVTNRYYLMDAVFLVGLEGKEDFLHTLDEALNAPVFPLYCGRRSCPPTGRLSLGVRQKNLKDALCEEPWQASLWYCDKVVKSKNPQSLTLVLDTDETGFHRRRDLPVSFNQHHRKYIYRYVNDIPHGVSIDKLWEWENRLTDHDAFSDIGGDDGVSVKD